MRRFFEVNLRVLYDTGPIINYDFTSDKSGASSYVGVAVELSCTRLVTLKLQIDSWLSIFSQVGKRVTSHFIAALIFQCL